MNAEQIMAKTKTMIDDLKTVCANFGLGNASSEYKIITEVFLYKFLNDKFLHEVREADSRYSDSKNIEEDLEKLSEEDYEFLLASLPPATAQLKREHFISYLFNHKNTEKYDELFDNTLIDIGNYNIDVFSVKTGSEDKIRLLDALSTYVTERNKRSDFCRTMIDKIVDFSFEDAFVQKYDFFAAVFEYLIKDYNKDFGKYAEYYTPHSIASIIAKIMVPDGAKNVTAYDPSAGSGTLVLALAHEIGEDNCTIYTQDISQKSNEFLRLNLILNNLVHSLSNVIHGDTLVTPQHFNTKKDGLKKFDYIVSNPPFNMDFSDNRDTLAGENYKERFWAGVPSIPAKDKDSMAIYLMFFQHILFSMKENGHAAIVVPTTFLTKNQKIEKALREKIVGDHMLRGIITMPSNIFATTTTSVSVVFLENNSDREKAILIDASDMGEKYKDGKNQRTFLRPFEINQIVEAFNSQKEIADFSVLVNYSEIEKNKYSLKARQYFKLNIERKDLTPDEYDVLLKRYHSEFTSLFNIDTICVNAVRTIYDYWFEQYEFPNKDDKPYRSSNGEMIYSAKLDRDIPVNWTVCQLSELCDILLGGTPDTSVSEYWDGDIPWLNSGEIAQFPIRESEKTITEEGRDNSATSFAKSGAVLLSITRYIRASILAIDACFNQSVVAVIPNDMVPTSFLYPFIESKIPLYMCLRTGAQQPHINKGTVEETWVALPPKKIMDKYVRYTNEIYADILKTTKEMAKEIKLSDFTMPALMST